ncbi:MAG: DUF2490 domain-containing protein [Brumimicrobium sp.]|nr:DUF2490 domain-containing protein [Brumimicrobium sp.]
MKQLILLILIFPIYTYAQITPSGVGVTQSAAWIAIGIHQKIYKKEQETKWTSESVIALGRMSYPNKTNSFKRPSIFTIRQDFKYSIGSQLNISIGVNYYTKYNYESTYPYHQKAVPFKHEIKTSSGIAYDIPIHFLTITPSLKQEFGQYFNPDFSYYTEQFRARTRARVKLKFNLTKDKKHAVILISEQLFSSTKQFISTKWSPFLYKDSRFSIYYSHTFTKQSIQLDIGYMHHLVGYYKPSSIHHFAIDIIWKNPFKSNLR